MANVQFKNVLDRIGNVGKAKKALDAAKANLERIGKAAAAERARVERETAAKVATAKAQYDAAFSEHAQIAALSTELEVFLGKVGNVLSKSGAKAKGTAAPVKAATKGKPGPKAKAAPAKAAVKAAPKGKPGPKAKAAPAKAKGTAAPKAREGVTMVDRLKAIIGTKTMTAGAIEEALQAQGNPPDSNNLRGYISSVLSSTKDKAGKKVFVAVKRGEYQVPSNHKNGTAPKAAASAPKAASTKKATPAVAAAPAAEPTPAPAASAAEGSPADAMMAELGIEGFGKPAEGEQPLA